MSTIDEIRKIRLEKLKKLEQAGLNAFASQTKRTHTIAQALADFSKLKKSKKEIVLAGRIMAQRGHGALLFLNIQDGSGSLTTGGTAHSASSGQANIQVIFRQDKIGENGFKFFTETMDVGDFIEVQGILIESKTGEKSLEATNFEVLTKTLLPLPEKWHGLQDTEEKLRKRYLDILFNPEIKQMIERRAIFWNAMREFLIDRGFLEVETPVLEITPGGADARPFITHHNALDIDVYLRISMGELWQKKLMVAGFEKTFEIGRQFRNEGMDAEHLQDYTQMEFYWAYADYNQGMEMVEELYKYIIKKSFNTLRFEINGHSIDFSKKWEKYDYCSTVQKYTGVNILEASIDEIEKALIKLGIDYDKKGFNKTRAIDNLWKYCRKKISGPGFLINQPIVLSPLAKRQEKNKDLAQKFQVILAGSEMGNGYSELNDPIDQAERFSEQQKLREAGDDEAQMFDHDFVEALEYGMPPTCGFGVSERLFSFLINKPMRECQIFPLMRPNKPEKASVLAKTATLKTESSSKSFKKLNVQKEIFDNFSDFIAGVILLKNVDNKGEVVEITQLLREAEKEQTAKLSAMENFSDHSQLNAWRMAYRKFGSDPHQYRCSAEALVRRVLKGDQLRHINKLVDLYNYISLKYVLPAGGEDTDRIAGNLALAFSDGTEPFIRLGGTENEPPQKGEVIYKDDKGVVCRRWNWREADRTKLTEQTKNAIIVIEALSPATKNEIETATQELAGLIKKHCGGEIDFYFLIKDNF